MVPIDKNQFLADVTMIESMFYSPHVKPIMLFGDGFLKSCNLIVQGFKMRLIHDM